MIEAMEDHDALLAVAPLLIFESGNRGRMGVASVY